MDAEKVTAELEALYPGSTIKRYPIENPQEIICEFDPKENHPDWSLSLAVIDRSPPHYHRATTVIYRVVQGLLTLTVGDSQLTMYEGQQFTVVPGNIHWASGNETWVEIYASPGFKSDDRLLVEA